MRETLRVIAAWIELPVAPDPRAAAEFAAALRTLATRMDHEERWARDIEAASQPGDIKRAAIIVQGVLARLDAQVEP